MAPHNAAEHDTMPAPAPHVFDDAPSWARALFVSSEETRAALVNFGERLATFESAVNKLSYRVGALSIAMTIQEHRTIQLEERPQLAPVIPMRGN